MKIKINGTDDIVEEKDITVLALLGLKNVEAPDMVSVQYNGKIIERSEFDSTFIQDGDDIEFLYFMGGGSL